MDILNLMKETHKDMLQELWDRNLIKIFKNNKIIYMNVCINDFLSSENISYNEFVILKRVPKRPHQQRCNVLRFIAAYLPDLNEKLWDTKWTEDQLIDWLNKKNINTLLTPADKHKVIKERKTRELSNKLLAQNKLQAVKALINNDAHSRNWHTVK